MEDGLTDVAQTLHSLGQSLSADLSGKMQAFGQDFTALRTLMTELHAEERQGSEALKSSLAELAAISNALAASTAR